MPIDALSVFCAQLTRDLLAIAKFLSITQSTTYSFVSFVMRSLAPRDKDKKIILILIQYYYYFLISMYKKTATQND